MLCFSVLCVCQQAFLESYLTPGPTLQYNSECWQALQWTLVSEASVTSPLRHGTEFHLKNNHFCLVVSSKAIPQLRISEEYVHPKSHKFVLQVQSETSVWPSAVSVIFIHNKLRSSVSFFTFFFFITFLVLDIFWYAAVCYFLKWKVFMYKTDTCICKWERACFCE